MDRGERGDEAINTLPTFIEKGALKKVGVDTVSSFRGRVYELNPAKWR
jgi:hypothetical protein